MKSVAVAPAFWGKHVYLGLITTMAEHMKRTYRHTGAWRRTNVANPGTRLAQEMSEITHRYATFLLKIAG